MIDTPDLTLADVLAREAGPPHVAMALGMEPEIEARTPMMCQNVVPPVGQPWGYIVPDECRGPVLLTLPKQGTPDVLPAATGQPYAANSLWGYPPFHRGASPVLAAQSAWGTVFGGGGNLFQNGTSSHIERETIIREDLAKEPAPVPVPAAGLLLGAGVAILGLFRRRQIA